jgi:hypothetical protein
MFHQIQGPHHLVPPLIDHLDCHTAVLAGLEGERHQTDNSSAATRLLFVGSDGADKDWFPHAHHYTTFPTIQTALALD